MRQQTCFTKTYEAYIYQGIGFDIFLSIFERIKLTAFICVCCLFVVFFYGIQTGKELDGVSAGKYLLSSIDICDIKEVSLISQKRFRLSLDL